MIQNVRREYISCCHSLFVWWFGMLRRGTSVASWRPARLPCGSSLCFTEYKIFNSRHIEAYGAILECEEAVCWWAKRTASHAKLLMFLFESMKGSTFSIVLYSGFQYLRKSVLHFVYSPQCIFWGIEKNEIHCRLKVVYSAEKFTYQQQVLV